MPSNIDSDPDPNQSTPPLSETSLRSHAALSADELMTAWVLAPDDRVLATITTTQPAPPATESATTTTDSSHDQTQVKLPLRVVGTYSTLPADTYTVVAEPLPGASNAIAAAPPTIEAPDTVTITLPASAASMEGSFAGTCTLTSDPTPGGPAETQPAASPEESFWVDELRVIQYTAVRKRTPPADRPLNLGTARLPDGREVTPFLTLEGTVGLLEQPQRTAPDASPTRLSDVDNAPPLPMSLAGFREFREELTDVDAMINAV